MPAPIRVRHAARPAPARLVADRRAVLRLLAAGPVLGADAGERCAELLGWTLDRWWAAVNGCGWVTCSGWGRAGWRVTWRGRKELERGAE